LNHSVAKQHLLASEGATAPASTVSCDVLVVGGGINGVSIARDLAGRGFKVVLCEKDDLAAATSSSSTKLIHGGLRYLEYYEFNLVRKSLLEREVLLTSAPHIMWPLRFVMPHDPSMRPVWMIRAGLFLYDHLAKRRVLAGSEAVQLAKHAAGQPLKEQFKRGFVYSDGWVDDARLVVLSAVDARSRGATILTRTECTAVTRGPAHWLAKLRGADGNSATVQARCLVNAAGPWAEKFLKTNAAQPDTKSLRLVKGSHIVVRKLFDHDYAYIFQNPDKRIIFAIPYEQDFTLIGTTDVEHHGEPGAAKIGQDEIDYLCAQASRYFRQPVKTSEVVWSYSGVRPLLDDEAGDPSAVTRDYLLEVNTDQAPVLSVWGGKMTTSRKLAEEAADSVCQVLQSSAPAWTAKAQLPGGNFEKLIGALTTPSKDFDSLVGTLQKRYSWLEPTVLRRLARCYGARVVDVLGQASVASSLGAQVAPGLFEAELRYLVRDEWARSADDVLWRRTKLGLHFSAQEQQSVVQWFESNQALTTAARLVQLQEELKDH
jgi:glycerol-3-phosphate dehydrogenase